MIAISSDRLATVTDLGVCVRQKTVEIVMFSSFYFNMFDTISCSLFIFHVIDASVDTD